MIVNCEECGKKYHIDPEKIRGSQARFTCRACGHVMTVSKPAEKPAAPPPQPAPPPESQPKTRPSSTASAAEQETGATKSKEEKKKKKAAVPKRLGLRSKMFILFFLVPILCIAASGWLYMQQLDNLSGLITGRSSDTVNRMAEELIELKAQTVARQCKIFLDGHPGLQKEDFNNNSEFREIAVQKVGTTGYTGVYDLKEIDGGCRTWAHVNPKIIGVDMRELKGSLGANFGPFWKIWSGVSRDKEARGYYNWRDPDNTIRAKYAVCTPIPGTLLAVGATTYMDEFTQPVKTLQQRASVLTRSTTNTILGIVAVTIILIGLIVSLFGHRLTSRIKSLTDVADRISVGELDADVTISSKDEIGDLANAVIRMQDSIRLSIERLRRNR